MARDDMDFEVPESARLADEVRLDGHSKPNEFVHRVLCFKAANVLEVISRW
jgi:hypothetical protein